MYGLYIPVIRKLTRAVHYQYFDGIVSTASGKHTQTRRETTGEVTRNDRIVVPT